MKSLKNILKLIILIALIFILIILFPKIKFIFSNIEVIIDSSGLFSPVVYILLMIIAILVSPIPSSPLVIIAGTVFGSFFGIIYTLIGATIGAVLAFLIARFFLRDFISKKIEKNNFYNKIKGKENKNIAKIILFTRLMPHISFDIVSHAAGLTGLNVFTFALVTFIGMIPIVFLLSFFGHLIEPYLSQFFIAILILFLGYIIYLYLRKSRK